MPNPNRHKCLFILALAAALALLTACAGDVGESEPRGAANPRTTPYPTAQAVPTALTLGAASPRTTPYPTATPSPAATATSTRTPAAVAERQSESALAQQTFAFLERFTSEYSPRESATDQELAAARFIEERLEAMGYDTAIQDFTVERLSSEVAISTSSGVTERIDSLRIALSQAGTASGALADAGAAFAEDIPASGLEGRVALIERGTITFEEKVKRVAESGADAAIVFNNEAGLFGGTLMERSAIPAVAIGRGDGLRLRAMVEAGGADATVSVTKRQAPSRNVIAQKRGAGSGGQTVIIGAHYDTVPDTQGANDNGSGVAALMSIARHVSGESYPFDVKLILFGSEEIGLFGSRHYVETMSEREISNTLAMLNLDVVGSGDSFEAIGEADMTREARRIGAEIGVRVSQSSELSTYASSDHAPFAEAGIPALFLLANDLSRINSPQDDIRHVSPNLVGWSAEIVIALLDWLAAGAGP